MRERSGAVEEVGLPKMVLMENAGRQVAALAQHILGPSRGKKDCRREITAVMVCGRPLLLKAGVAVVVFSEPGEGMGLLRQKPKDLRSWDCPAGNKWWPAGRINGPPERS